MKIKNQTFVCIDCETTGLDTENDRIIEVAIVKFTFDEILKKYESLIDPKREIPAESTKIHHIVYDMVKGKPLIEDILPTILEIAGDHPIVGHSVLYDIVMLVNAAKRAGIPCKLDKNPVYDTLRMARKYGESKVNSLETLRKHFNITEEGAHRAMSDVIVNVEVFRQLSSDYESVKDLEKMLSKPIKMRHMPLGKHKGRLFKDIPVQYLKWAVNKDFDEDLLFSIRSELKRRNIGNPFGQAANPFCDL